jgi:hypothetical protein
MFKGFQMVSRLFSVLPNIDIHVGPSTSTSMSKTYIYGKTA